MAALSDRTDEFLSAPVCAAFFVLAHRYGLDADHLAQPSIASSLLSDSIAWLNPWSGTAAADRTDALRQAPPHRPLVTDVLADPRNTWWSAPLDRTGQLLLLDAHALATTPPPDPMDVPVPDGPGDEWQVYAQRPAHHIMTTTGFSSASSASSASAVCSGAHAELSRGVSDWDAAYPITQQRLHVASTARVAEVHSAADWHHLATAYGDQRAPSDDNLWQSAGIDNGPAPVWSHLAEHTDAVHVSFAGLLSGLYVPVSSPGARATTLWAWYFESTWWMRSGFTAVEQLPPLLQAPEADHLQQN